MVLVSSYDFVASYEPYFPRFGSVILDLFIRRGYITPDNEPEFMKIINRLHGTFDYNIW